MPEVTLPGRMAVLGRVLVEAWPDHGHDWDVTYATVALVELLNALLAGRRDVAAELLAEIEKVAER